MAGVERLSITLPAEMAASLRQTVEGGQYASASEVIREALREWRHRCRASIRTGIPVNQDKNGRRGFPVGRAEPDRRGSRGGCANLFRGCASGS